MSVRPGAVVGRRVERRLSSEASRKVVSMLPSPSFSWTEI
jgi:hypothetical protein